MYVLSRMLDKKLSDAPVYGSDLMLVLAQGALIHIDLTPYFRVFVAVYETRDLRVYLARLLEWA
jgi:hypothetical protein